MICGNWHIGKEVFVLRGTLCHSRKSTGLSIAKRRTISSLSALGLSKTFRIASKAVDLVGNPVREIGYIAFVAAYVEGIEG